MKTRPESTAEKKQKQDKTERVIREVKNRRIGHLSLGFLIRVSSLFNVDPTFHLDSRLVRAQRYRKCFTKLKKAELWRNGSTLHYLVQTKDVAQSLRDLLQTTLKLTWECYANIRFTEAIDLADAKNADFRIHFGAGLSSSPLGTRAKSATTHINFDFGPNALGEVTKESPIMRKILHEFGHLLGLIHEHQRPCSPLRFDLVLLRYIGARKDPNWAQSLKKDFLRMNHERIALLDLFPYDDFSIMQYNFDSLVAKSQTSQSKSHELSDKDKALMAYLYPKPSGGTMEIEHQQKLYSSRQRFLAARRSEPQALVGITAMGFRPYPSAIDLWITPTEVSGEGFQYTYSSSDARNGAISEVHYLAIDPHIKEIHVASPLMRNGHGQWPLTNDTVDFLKKIREKSLDAVTWIKQITVESSPVNGSVYLTESDSLPVVELEGAISSVVYNWLAFSSTAINIAAGRFVYGLDSSIILVSKNTFLRRPQILFGISGFSFSRGPANDHSVWFQFNILDDFKHDDQDSWGFRLNGYGCCSDCLSGVRISWVAVSREYESVSRPMPREAMANLVSQMDKKNRDEEERLEAIGRMSEDDIRAYYHRWVRGGKDHDGVTK
ncbi:hypothetical protein FKW77_001531 [Venturia effusa]|uniref:Peptidase M12A domain-containing protein n=1 Tax=Venturia effusa TaxID=50376 RepID=A0A517LI46_9PEZI|nr:hypothetical protein FKW77_001531 [Venturia effusa]